MVQYLLLDTDGESDDPALALTSDTTSSGGVLGGDTYTAAHTISGVTEDGAFSALGADVTLESVSDAALSVINTFPRTSQPEALSDVVSDITLATATTLSSLEEAVTGTLSDIQNVSTTTLGSSTSDALPEVTNPAITSQVAIAGASTLVTPVAQIPIATATPQQPESILDVVLTVTPTESTLTPLSAGGTTETAITALTQNAGMVALTPTTSIVIMVDKTGVGVESAFADSLAASVGAQTTIKVAKTIGSTDPQLDDAIGSSSADVLRTALTAETLTDAGFSESVADAVQAAALFEVLGFSSTTSTSVGVDALVGTEEVEGGLTTAAVSEAAVRDVIASELESSGITHTNVEVLSQAAETLIEDGVVDSKADAALAVTEAVTETFRTDEDTSVIGDALTSDIQTFDRTGRPSTFFLLFQSLTGKNNADIDASIANNDVIITNDGL